MSTDKANECRSMIDYLLDRAQEGKLKYEYVLFHRQIYLHFFGLYLSDHIPCQSIVNVNVIEVLLFAGWNWFHLTISTLHWIRHLEN